MARSRWISVYKMHFCAFDIFMTPQPRPDPLAFVPRWFWVWALLVGAMLLVRPALPIDETRYLAAAWEMWWRGSIAVPYLNGNLYAGKPPLFFWLMHLGWWTFGVNEWWPRLIAPVFGLGILFLVRAIATRLWRDAAVTGTAPWLLLGSLLWAGMCASTMFDMLLGFFATLSVYAIVRAWQDGDLRYFSLAGLALGLGILAKGPVVFLPALFIVAFAPWWMKAPGARPFAWRAWYVSALGAVAIAALIALVWVVPMALASDPDYLRNILFKQTLGYTVRSFSHARAVWWYLPLLPVVLFPWTLWPRAWRAAFAVRPVLTDSGVRLCLVWTIAVFVAFSLISGKRAHYLLLFFPAVALLLARLLPTVERGRDDSLLVPALVYAMLGALFIAAAHGDIPRGAAEWLTGMPGGLLYAAGGGLMALGLAVAACRGRALGMRIAILAMSSCAMLLVVVWVVMQVAWPAYDVRALSRELSVLEANGAQFAQITRYDGQFTFHGRLRRRVETIIAGDAVRWSREHPRGYVFAFYSAGRQPPMGESAPVLQQRYRGGTMAIWRAPDIVAHPQIAATFE